MGRWVNHSCLTWTPNHVYRLNKYLGYPVALNHLHRRGFSGRDLRSQHLGLLCTVTQIYRIDCEWFELFMSFHSSVYGSLKTPNTTWIMSAMFVLRRIANQRFGAPQCIFYGKIWSFANVNTAFWLNTAGVASERYFYAICTAVESYTEFAFTFPICTLEKVRHTLSLSQPVSYISPCLL